ncbi:MAG: hypothetical protein KAU12_03445, partial [Candidatus Omnitrophica bacterium]|nr:hypothetical protein [Candidatus Omnitrophota bacterium]
YAFRLWRNSKKDSISDAKKSEEMDFSIKFFFTLTFVAFLFSLYPIFVLFGRELKLPSYYIYQMVPFFRAIGRFGIVLMLAISVLMAFGIKFLFERINSPKAKVSLAILFAIIVVFEFINFPPFKATDIGASEEVYFWLKEQPVEILIVEYPIEEDDNVEYLFNQRVHQKKIVNGALRGTEAYSVTEKIVNILEPQTAGILEDLGVTYVIIHIPRYTQRSERKEVKAAIEESAEKYNLYLEKDFRDTKVYRIKK